MVCYYCTWDKGGWVLFRTTPTHLEIVITWCYHKPFHIKYFFALLLSKQFWRIKMMYMGVCCLWCNYTKAFPIQCDSNCLSLRSLIQIRQFFFVPPKCVNKFTQLVSYPILPHHLGNFIGYQLENESILRLLCF